MTEESRLLTEQHGRVLTVRFNNPPRNFFDEQMSIELDDLTRCLHRDPTVGAVVFTGRDTTYMTHFDVGDLLRASRSMPIPVGYATARIAAVSARHAVRVRAIDRLLRRTPAQHLMLLARIYAALDRLNRMDKVIVTAINGLAFGMGCVFALACDIRVIAGDCEIGLTEASLNMLAAAGGTQRMARMIGTGRALELLLDGRWITAIEAADLGLVHRVVAAGDLQQHAHDIAERLARRSPVNNRELKRMIYDAGTRPFVAGLAREAASAIVTVTSRQAERTMTSYQQALESNVPLTDADVKCSLQTLADTGVPNGPNRTPSSLGVSG